MFFMNGEAHPVAGPARPGIRRLADDRQLAAPVNLPVEFWDVAHAWYLQGFVHVGGMA
jgi:hypothetical protein